MPKRGEKLARYARMVRSHLEKLRAEAEKAEEHLRAMEEDPTDPDVIVAVFESMRRIRDLFRKTPMTPDDRWN